MSAASHKKYFLPYQVRWLKDDSPVKIWEKSRRIGATYVQSYEDVRDAVSGRVPAVWFSSADESAAREYIMYCEKWVKMFDMAAKNLGRIVLDSERDIKTYTIELANGVRINALSSNPKAFRSKGGKVVLDEFAWHDHPDQMWAAAKPVTTWGYPLRILSTHNGKNSRFYKFIDAIKKGKLNWSLHVTDIFKAVEEGLVDKILGRRATEEEKQAWIQEQHDSCFDEDTWLQEYCCVPVDQASAFLPYDLITACEMEIPDFRRYQTVLNDKPLQGDLYVGMDIGRKRDLSVIWGIQKIGAMKFTLFVVPLERTPFHIQRDVLFSVLAHPELRRAAIDATGLGMQLAEEAQTEFGKYRVEAVTFTARAKEEMAYRVRMDFEDRTVRIPADYDIREDLHSVRKVTTAAGNIRFDVAATEQGGHADYFWALALALHAAQDEGGPVYIASRSRRKAYGMVKGY